MLQNYSKMEKELTEMEVARLNVFVSKLKVARPPAYLAVAVEGENESETVQKNQSTTPRKRKNNKFDDGDYGTGEYRSEYLEFLRRIRADKNFVSFTNSYLKSAVEGISIDEIIIKLASNICRFYCCGLDNTLLLDFDVLTEKRKLLNNLSDINY